MAIYPGEEDPVHGRHYSYGRNSFMQENFTNPSGTYGTHLEREWAREIRGSHYGKGPKGFKHSDTNILDRVSEALYNDLMIDASDITVNVKDGEVVLTGFVDDKSAKRVAEAYAENLDGVQNVINRLKIKKQHNRNI